MLARRARFCRIARTTRSRRAVYFFVARLRPAATYDAKVTSISTGALRNLRQLASHAMRLKANGRSLTAVSLLHGDPAGRLGYAPPADLAFRTSSTPSAPFSPAPSTLPVARLGRTWPSPFEFADNDGSTYHIFHVSPQTIRHVLHRATLDRLAEKLANYPLSRRVIYEPVCKLLRSASLSPQQKGLVATVFVGGIWPRDRLRAADYDAPSRV